MSVPRNKLVLWAGIFFHVPLGSEESVGQVRGEKTMYFWKKEVVALTSELLLCKEKKRSSV